VSLILRFAVVAVLLSSSILPAAARKKPTADKTACKADIEPATRLQIFLDRADFSPGKLDGHYSDFTWKALALYRQSRGEQLATPPPQTKAKRVAAPDVSGLDLANVDPVFVVYTVNDADLQSVGLSPSNVSAQAKLKSLPYRDAAEAIAEKFHSDVHFLEQLNPGKTKTIKVGDQLTIPNVEPFELASVKDIKPGSDVPSQAANDVEDQPDAQSQDADKNNETKTDRSAATPVVVKICRGDKLLVRARIDIPRPTCWTFLRKISSLLHIPVTIGSAQTASPIGEWKVTRITKMPTFRYDKEMLNTASAAAISIFSRPVRTILSA
jgi:LysM repeat protein